VKKLIALLCLCAFLAAGFAACDKKPTTSSSPAKPAGGTGGGDGK
jgi:hypothetical protein